MKREKSLEREKSEEGEFGMSRSGRRETKELRPHLKSTIEIQDPYAKSAAGKSGRGSWKIGRKEERDSILLSR